MDNKISNIEYIKRLRLAAAAYAKAGYYTYAQHYLARADNMEIAERAKLAMLAKEKLWAIKLCPSCGSEMYISTIYNHSIECWACDGCKTKETMGL